MPAEEKVSLIPWLRVRRDVPAASGFLQLRLSRIGQEHVCYRSTGSKSECRGLRALTEILPYFETVYKVLKSQF